MYRRGTLGPEEFSLLKVVYTPKHTGTFTCENYVMSTAGGNRLTLTLRGTATGPRVTLSTRALNFGSVPCGSAASRVLYLTNHSDIAVAYDFQVSEIVGQGDTTQQHKLSWFKMWRQAGLSGHSPKHPSMKTDLWQAM
jgi:hypothetical protein